MLDHFSSEERSWFKISSMINSESNNSSQECCSLKESCFLSFWTSYRENVQYINECESTKNREHITVSYFFDLHGFLNTCKEIWETPTTILNVIKYEGKVSRRWENFSYLILKFRISMIKISCNPQYTISDNVISFAAARWEQSVR